MTNTLTTINWTRTPYPGGFAVYKGARSGWMFSIRLAKSGRAVLTANHMDGRIPHETSHDTLKLAKAAAFGLMRPSEAIGWRSGTYFGRAGYAAHWDRLAFVAAVMPGGTFRVAFRDGDGAQPWQLLAADVTLTGARDAARRLLDERYPLAPAGPQTTAQPSVAEQLSAALAGAWVDASATQIEEALSAAGLRLTVGAQV